MNKKEKTKKIIMGASMLALIGVSIAGGGALAKYIASPNDNFQPMNANFGILKTLEENVKDKKRKYGKLSERALTKIINLKKVIDKELT